MRKEDFSVSPKSFCIADNTYTVAVCGIRPMSSSFVFGLLPCPILNWPILTLYVLKIDNSIILLVIDMGLQIICSVERTYVL